MPSIDINLVCGNCGRSLDGREDGHNNIEVDICQWCLDNEIQSALENCEPPPVEEPEDRYQEGYDDGYKKAMEDYGE